MSAFGGLFSSDKKTTTTTVENRQIGQQGSGNLGISGNVGGPLAIGGTVTSLGAIRAGGDVNVISSDVFALEFAERFGVKSLESQQGLALASVNAANQVAINALETLQTTHSRDADLVGAATMAAQTVALTATPVSPGAYAEAIAGQNTKTTLIIAAIGAVIIVAAMLKK